jgi:hypothetical protein
MMVDRGAYPKTMNVLKDAGKKSMEQQRREAASAEAQAQSSQKGAGDGVNPDDQYYAAPMDTTQKPLFKDDGGWSYVDLGDGRVQIMSAPAGSKAKGKILDPSKIPTISDPVARDRAQKAYDSIVQKMSGYSPVLAPSQEQEGGKLAAGAPSKTPPARDVTGGLRNPPASAGGVPDSVSAVTPTGRGAVVNPSSAGMAGPGALDAATATPARSFPSLPHRR